MWIKDPILQFLLLYIVAPKAILGSLINGQFFLLVYSDLLKKLNNRHREYFVNKITNILVSIAVFVLKK
jgi:hypothetical protein